jgi:acetylornithine/LysW-gamma-L-lysine aminotransferase
MTEVTATDYAAIQREYEFNVYPKRDIVLVRGRGAKVWDEKGREYVDASGGYGVAIIGHCHPAVNAAIARQSERLHACPGSYYCDVRARLMAELAEITPGRLNRSFLCNSGTEANEAAIKVARFATGRVPIVCAARGFHGRTMGALSATFDPKHKDAFGPLVPGFTHVPFNSVEKLEEAVTAETAAVMLEVVQGEGGVHVADREFLHCAQTLCRQHGALLVVDEVQTGFGRTGRMFASMHYDLEPDIMTVAKGIAGGLPLGAAICTDEIEVPYGRHGSTFGGSPLCCAAATLDRVRAIRHVGHMIGIEVQERVPPVLAALLERGVIALPAGTTVLRLLPPLVLTDDELEFVATQVIDVLK